MPVKIFFCYAHKDATLLTELQTHLIPLRLEGLIDFWYDRDISAGMKWEQQIKEHLNAAQIILLLISPDFMASDYINNVELKRALERDERGEARVIPVILRHASWKIPTLRNLQALPTDAKPIKSWSDLDEAFVNVTEGIRKVVEQISVKLAAQAAEEQQAQSSASSAETSAHIKAAEPTTPVVDEPKPAPSKPAKLPEAEPTPSAVIVPKQAPATPLLSLKPEVLSLLRTFSGHKESVRSVAFSPDGQTLASGSGDRTIKLWNLASVKDPRTLHWYNLHWYKGVESVAFSPDGQTLASVSREDLTIWLWNLASGQELRTLPGHPAWVESVAFSPAGQTLASGSSDDTIMLWNVTTGKEVQTLTGHTDSVWSVAFSPAGQTLASGSSDKTIKIWGEK